MFFNEDHLKITKVRTADGISPVLGADGRVATKVIYAPLNKTTQKSFEEQNTRLPTSLKMKIEVISGYVASANHVIYTPEADELKKKILELEAENLRLSEQLTSTVAQKPSVSGNNGVEVKELDEAQKEKTLQNEKVK